MTLSSTRTSSRFPARTSFLETAMSWAPGSGLPPGTKAFRTKSGHERVIPITGRAVEILTHLFRENGSSQAEYVFMSRRGRRGDAKHLDPLYTSRRFREYRKAEGVPEGVRFHSLRLTYCTWLCVAEVPVPVVQRLAGHADITTTMVYVHVAGEDLHRAVQTVF